MENSKVTVEQLKEYDIKICIDRSGSMGEPHGSTTRWIAAQESTKALVRECAKIDTDGVSIVLFGGKDVKNYDNVTDADKVVVQIFAENSPMGGTPTAEMLKKQFDAYFAAKDAGKNPKPIIMAVITDGEPTDKAAVVEVITDASNKLETGKEIGVTFLQVGSDPGAAAFLKSLDDDLKSAKHDIVDTMNLDEVPSVVEAILGAVND